MSLLSSGVSLAALAPAPPPPTNPNCLAVYNACTQAGYIYGDAGKGNGLYRDCTTPLLTGTAVLKPVPARIVFPAQGDFTGAALPSTQSKVRYFTLKERFAVGSQQVQGPT